MKRLENKICLITGAAQGIGQAIAEEFARQGAFVYLTDINDELGENEARKIGNMAKYLHLDVANETKWENVIDQIKNEKGRLDILVNNAGIIGLDMGPQDPEHASLESWKAVHQINLDGVFLGCKHGIHLMKKTGGSIINMSSRSGLVGIPACAAYASSKAAIRNHSKSVALWCAQNNYHIRCNSIHPGAILTNIWNPMLGESSMKEENIKKMSSSTPLKRFGTPLEVAHLAVYLASDESQYVTGSEFNIDGGILAGSVASPQVISTSNQ